MFSDMIQYGLGLCADFVEFGGLLVGIQDSLGGGIPVGIF